jgi:hypothetical protein
MVTKKSSKKKTFWETYKGKIKTTLIAAICTALGVWMFTMVKGGCESVALSIDQKYNNQAMMPEIEKKVIAVEKKMEEQDAIIAQQSVKTFEMYQQKLNVQNLEELKIQKSLVLKELSRDPNNEYLKDRLAYLNKRIEVLEKQMQDK